MKRFFKKASERFFTALAAMMVAGQAFAQSEFNFETMANDATTALNSTLKPIINIVQMIIALIAVVMLVWNYIKRAKNDGQSNDALAAWGFSLLIALAGLQVVKMVFLK